MIDTKDNWEAFMPFGLRRAVARRFASAKGLTTNAQLHEGAAQPYFPSIPYRLVYSGVAEPFFRARAKPPREESAERTILLVGGIYRPATLGQFLAAVARWRSRLSLVDQARLRLHYVGASNLVVADAIASTDLSAITQISPFVPLDQFAGLVGDSFCAAYLWLPTGFHHKLLELSVAARAVIAFPGEHPESIRLAQQCDTPFAVCADGDELASTLDELWAASSESANRSAAPPWHWDDFAVGLEQFFETIVADRNDR
ncbi:MAG: hypothetical protein ABIO85_03230 [Sphingomicrobium sp.]